MSRSSEYHIWQHMKTRCYKEDSISYKNYGARGITVCDRWLQSFENFYADMGERPEGTSLDRIDNEGNYEPSNCRWTTSKIQANNKRGNRVMDIDGESHTLSEWSDISGIKLTTIHKRLNYLNWSPKEAIFTPLQNYGKPVTQVSDNPNK